jgi:hypothetical protein
MGVDGQHHAPATSSSKENRYPLYRKLGGPQGRSGRVGKISPSPGFDPRTVQPVASSYTTELSRPTILLSTRPNSNQVNGDNAKLVYDSLGSDSSAMVAGNGIYTYHKHAYTV